MRSIFSIDNPIFAAISRVGDLFVLSLLWLTTSIPIFTIGASTTALYDCTLRILRKRDTSIFKDYFRAFRNNFKQSTAMFLIMLPIGAVILADMYFWANREGEMTFIMNALSVGMAVLYAATLMFLFPVQAVFENKVKDTMRTAFLMSVKHWKVSLVLLASVFAIGYLCYNYLIAAYCFLIIGTGAFAMIFSHQFITVFRLYNPELNPDEVEAGAGEPVLQKTSSSHSAKHSKSAKPIKIKGSKIIK